MKKLELKQLIKEELKKIILENQITAEKLIGVVDKASQNGETVTIQLSNKTYKLDKFIFQHFKTIEFKLAGVPKNIKIKKDAMVTVLSN